MSIYQYECKDCKKKFELRQDISEDPIITCIFCGEDCFRIITGGCGFILKGSGWYKDGYASKKKE